MIEVVEFQGHRPVLFGIAYRETISLAFLVLLDALSPEERAVFLLHDVFARRDDASQATNRRS